MGAQAAQVNHDVPRQRAEQGEQAGRFRIVPTLSGRAGQQLFHRNLSSAAQRRNGGGAQALRDLHSGARYAPLTNKSQPSALAAARNASPMLRAPSSMLLSSAAKTVLFQCLPD